MIRNKIKSVTIMVAALAALLPLSALAFSHVTKDDPAVMNRLVQAQMVPLYMTAPKESGTLLLSDSPEYAENDGILYSDEVKGQVRMYFYHVNQSNEPRKVVVMAYNPAKTDQVLTLDHFAYSRPSTAYYTVGKELSLLYYETEKSVVPITVPADGYAIIGERLNSVVVRPDELFSGILDMTVPDTMTVSSIIMPYNANPYQFVRRLLYQASDSSHLRGTFYGADREIRTLNKYSPDDGIGYIKLGDDLRDRFAQGRDALENRSSSNRGNYGIDYNIDIRTKGDGLLHLYFNPQGGGYAGVLALRRSGGLKLVEIPGDPQQYNLGDDNTYAMQYVDTFAAGEEVRVHLMPPGAANLPVRLIIVPDKILKDVMADVDYKNDELNKVISTMDGNAQPGTAGTAEGKKDKPAQKKDTGKDIWQLMEEQQRQQSSMGN